MNHADSRKPSSTLLNEVLPKLRPFQREALEFATQGKRYSRQWASSSTSDNNNNNNTVLVDKSLLGKGRILLADEMGLGKTVTSLAIMAYYWQEWQPLLILCPASLRYTWPAEIEKFFPSLPPQSIYVAKGFQDVAFTKRKDIKVLILTYSLFQERSAVQQAVKSREWPCIIADESHNLKSKSSQRSKLILPLLQRAKRLVLLSGTPALAKPVELWTQVACLAPKLFGNWTTFTNRYCKPTRKSFGPGRFVMDYSGSSNETELHAKLKQIMIRRLKNDVLQELPAKQRSQCPVSIVGREEIANCKQIMKEIHEKPNQDGMFGDTTNDFEAKARLMRAYQATGIGKASAVSDYLVDWLAGTNETQKILVFAHHKQVLDRLDQTLCAKWPNTHMRIDGSVPPVVRAQLVRKFQTCARVRVALLSVTAAGVGLTLTAASTVLFAELHWTPGVLAQAEDRAHRIGQKHDSVQIIYMVCKDKTMSIDMTLWKLLGRKINTLDQVVDGKEEMPYLFAAQEGPVAPKVKSAQEELTEFFAETSTRETRPKTPAKGSIESFFVKVPPKSANKNDSSSNQKRAISAKSATSQSSETAFKKRDRKQDDARGTEVACDVCTFLNAAPPLDKEWFPCEACGNLIKQTFVPFGNKKKRSDPSSSSKPATANQVKWSCAACTLENCKKRSTSGWYTCAACDEPYLESTEFSDDDSDSEMDELLKTPVLDRKPSRTVTVSTPRRQAARASSPLDQAIVLDNATMDLKKPASQSSQVIEVEDSPVAFTKTARTSSPELIVLDDEDEVSNVKPKALASSKSNHVLEFSVSEHSGRITVHFAENGQSSLVNFAVEDVVTDEAADRLLDARIKKVSLDKGQIAIEFDRQRVWVVLEKVRSGNQNRPRNVMEDELKNFVTNYLRLRPIEKKTIQKSGKAFPAVGLAQSIAKLLVDSYSGTERYLGGAKERAQENAAKGKASSRDLSILDGRCCAWCGNYLSEASMRGEAVYCSQECAEEGRLRRGGKFASANIRSAVFALEEGKCTICGLNVQALFEQIRSLQPSERLNKLLDVNWTLPKSKKALESLLKDPKEGQFWQVDHIRAVAEGGGGCGLDNLRTLCVPCHNRETAKLHSRLKLSASKGGESNSSQLDIRTAFATAKRTGGQEKK